MLKTTDEVHVAGLTYSEKAVQGWHKTRAQDVILVAEVNGTVTGFVAAKFGDPKPGGACSPGSSEDIEDFFSAPIVPGEYEFYDEVVDGSREKIIGKMIVE